MKKRGRWACAVLWGVWGCVAQVQGALEACFTPGENCVSRIIAVLDRAQDRIGVQGYYLTSGAITEALVRARQRGVEVQVILDKSQEKARSSRMEELMASGIEVRIDRKPAIAHNKIMLVDDHTLITGSYNWTESAEKRNAENILVVTGEPEIMARYRENFIKRRSASSPPRGGPEAAPGMLQRGRCDTFLRKDQEGRTR